MECGEVYHSEGDAKSEFLKLMNTNLKRLGGYAGYPDFQSRLSCPLSSIELVGGHLSLPSGPWDITGYKSELPSLGEQQIFVNKGIPLDTLGRPLHPYFAEMLENPLIGVVLGRGFYYNWGANNTADAIVTSRQGRVLLIKRQDTNTWALPGGFVDDTEDPCHAVLRELFEETGVNLSDLGSSSLVYKGPVADIRLTAHAWPETTALKYVIDDDSKVTPKGGDDALLAKWIPIDYVMHNMELFGSHKYLLSLSL